jgi:DNA polymerase-3 subunit delta
MMAKKQSGTSVEELERSLESGTLLPVYLFVGEEQFLRHKARNLVHDVIVGRQGGSVAVFTPDDPLEAVLSELRGDSLFASRRMVELMQAEAFLRDHGDAIVRYLEHPSASAVLVIDAMKVDGRTRLPAAIRAAGMVVECPLVYENQLPGWVKAEVHRRGFRISPAAVSFLIDEVGNSLFALSGEIDKLITYAGDRKTIEPPDVAQLTGHTRNWVVWALTDALARKEVASAIRILENLLQEDDRGIGIVGILNWQISRLWQGRCVLDRGGSRDELMTRLHIDYKKVDALQEQIRKFSQEDLSRLSRLLLKTDIALKSTGLPPRAVLERFLVEACRVR